MAPGHQTDLLQAVERLPAELQAQLARHNFSSARWLEQHRRLITAAPPPSAQAAVELPRPSDLFELPPRGSAEATRLEELGLQALRRGECALIVLAGGMATRMGGVVKALAEAIDGHSFLDLRLAEQASWGRKLGITPPLWLMTSHGTDAAITQALGQRQASSTVATFPQSVSLRWTPDGQIYRGENGLPSLYATGHGDLPEALAASGLLREFVARGGTYVMVCNIDNLGAGLDPLLIGAHLDGQAAISCEVVEKQAGDRGGIPVRIDGRTVIQEEFLLPPDFKPEDVRVFNSNTLAFQASALQDLELDWSYFEVHKRVDGHEVVQFERLIHEATFGLETRYLKVPRDGLETRFLPVKDQAELEARRPAIQALAAARGML